MNNLEQSFSKLKQYVESEKFLGYDPYDILNTPLPIKYLGKWPGVILTQIQKRNPINIRPLLGIKKEINPTAFGIFLQAYSLLYQHTHKKEYLEQADYFYEYLKSNYSKGYAGYAWGLNFPWASSDGYYEAFTPSSVVTGIVCNGLWQYYQITKKDEVPSIIISASNFILENLEVYSDDTGKCISYTPQQQTICYNASLISAEILAKASVLSNDEVLKQSCIELVEFVIARQKSEGEWFYSEDVKTGEERRQIDFHQGYVLESIYEIRNLLDIKNENWDNALKKGLEYYYQNQFYKNGRSLFRLPKEYPVDIHNQSQGIITFVKLKEFNDRYLNFANTILNWTVENMQHPKGYFFYKKYKYITDKNSYIRWGQAFMFLAQVHSITASTPQINFSKEKEYGV